MSQAIYRYSYDRPRLRALDAPRMTALNASERLDQIARWLDEETAPTSGDLLAALEAAADLGQAAELAYYAARQARHQKKDTAEKAARDAIVILDRARAHFDPQEAE